MTELKPCPFCGGEAKLQTTSINTGEWVYCKKCYCNTNSFTISKNEAIKAWNNRAEPPNDPLTFDELKKMVDEPVWVEIDYGDWVDKRWRVISNATSARIDYTDGWISGHHANKVNFYRKKPEVKNE